MYLTHLKPDIQLRLEIFFLLHVDGCTLDLKRKTEKNKHRDIFTSVVQVKIMLGSNFN